MVLLQGYKGKTMSNRQSSSYYLNDQYDFDEELDGYKDKERDESDEDTEEASETEMRKNDEHTEMKEIVYRDKLQNLKRQLDELKDYAHPDYCKKLKKLEIFYRESLRANEVWRDYLIECVERDYINEKRAASKEFEEKKIELQQNLITDLEAKKKKIEADRESMELNGDNTKSKPSIRSLRRRPNDPPPAPDKRRGKHTTQATSCCVDNFRLEDKEIENDMKSINKQIKSFPPMRKPSHSDFTAIGNDVSRENYTIFVNIFVLCWLSVFQLSF